MSLVTLLAGCAQPQDGHSFQADAEPLTVAATADDILVRGGAFRPTPHQKITMFMEWIGHNIGFGLGKSDPLYTIQYKIGACGSMSNLLIALAETQGIKGRIVNLYNYPIIGRGHTATEFYWGGKWRYYDPTYGFYYVTSTTDRANFVDPDVASFAQAKDDPKLIVDQNLVGFPGRRMARAVRSSMFSKEERPYLSGVYTQSDAFIQANPSGPIGPDVPMLFPIPFNLAKRDVDSWGSPDGSVEDTSTADSPQALYMIGSAYHNVNHRYSLIGVAAGERARIRIHFMEMKYSHFELMISATGADVVGDKMLSLSKDSPSTVDIVIRAESDSPEVTVTHPYTDGATYLSVDSVEARRL